MLSRNFDVVTYKETNIKVNKLTVSRRSWKIHETDEPIQDFDFQADEK